MADTHSSYMRRALKLAQKGKYTASPNPMVGCVIVKNNRIIAEGWHEKAGLPHAEINALKNVRGDLKGARVYVTLEPCCHHGRTPPCVDALIQSGVKEVYIATKDPNPLVAGKGIKKLEEHGIKVHLGACEKAAKQLNKFFFHYIVHKRPYVIAKWAMSLDGKTVVNPLDTPALSCAKAWREVHRLRQSVDAILVGANTVIKDNPMLTARIKSPVTKQPLRVILSSHGNLPLEARVLSTELPGKTLVITSEHSPLAWRKNVESQGIEVIILPVDAKGKISIPHLLDELGKRQIISLLVEGGMQVHQSFMAANCIDEIQAALCPVIIGPFAKKRVVTIKRLKLLDSDYSFVVEMK